MPFGAHETMETHEILAEKINMINHFHLYAMHTQNPQLRGMIVRHRQESVRSYNEMVAYTHDYSRPQPAPIPMEVSGVTPQQIQYGLHNPAPFGPESNGTFNDREIATAMLLCHKNGARSAMWACLECADPNLRRMLMNSSVACANQAYEVFLFMNAQGMYQVPTMNDHTAKTFMHSYQPTTWTSTGMGMGMGMGMSRATGMGMSAGASVGAGGMGMGASMSPGGAGSYAMNESLKSQASPSASGNTAMYGDGGNAAGAGNAYGQAAFRQ